MRSFRGSPHRSQSLAKASKNIDAFDFKPGRMLAGKYEVVNPLGCGFEGEVYLIREKATGIERTAKFFFPQRNVRAKNALFHANKLHALRHCPNDVVEAVRVFYESLGGKKYYSTQPPEVKAICCGLKRTLILRKFASAGRLRHHLETMDWS